MNILTKVDKFLFGNRYDEIKGNMLETAKVMDENCSDMLNLTKDLPDGPEKERMISALNSQKESLKIRKRYLEK